MIQFLFENLFFLLFNFFKNCFSNPKVVRGRGNHARGQKIQTNNNLVVVHEAGGPLSYLTVSNKTREKHIIFHLILKGKLIDK
jgi:hypothetical protein